MVNWRSAAAVILGIFRLQGRLRRGRFWLALVSAWLLFAFLYWSLDAMAGQGLTLVLYPPMLLFLVAASARRGHDVGISAYWLFLLLVPVLGPLWYLLVLGLRGSEKADNRFGTYAGPPLPDYLAVS